MRCAQFLACIALCLVWLDVAVVLAGRHDALGQDSKSGLDSAGTMFSAQKYAKLDETSSIKNLLANVEDQSLVSNGAEALLKESGSDRLCVTS